MPLTFITATEQNTMLEVSYEGNTAVIKFDNVLVGKRPTKTLPRWMDAVRRLQKTTKLEGRALYRKANKETAK